MTSDQDRRSDSWVKGDPWGVEMPSLSAHPSGSPVCSATANVLNLLEVLFKKGDENWGPNAGSGERWVSGLPLSLTP